MLIAENKQVKHGHCAALRSSTTPKKVAMIHCRGHLKGDAELMKEKQ